MEALMKRIVDVFTQDWSHEIVWTYVIELGDSTTPTQIEMFENEALRLAVEENRGNPNFLFAKARE
jgi:hypothetical protein